MVDSRPAALGVEEATGWGRAVLPARTVWRGGRSGGQGSSTCMAGTATAGGLPVAPGQGAAAGGGLPVAALAVAAGAHPQVLKEVHLQGQQLRTVCLEVASWVLSQVLPEVQRQGRLLQGLQPQVPEAGS